MLLPSSHQYVNFHAHRHAHSHDEWVLTNLMIEEFPEKIGKGSYSVGFHPWSIAGTDVREALSRLENAMSHPGIIAVGEAGLDKAVDVPIELQGEVFEKQLRIAEDGSLPVIVHCVRADAELIAHRKKHKKLKMICHGFSGSRERAQELIRHGFYLSVGPLVFKSEKLQQVLNDIPSDRLLLETDDSDTEIAKLYTFVSTVMNTEVSVLQHKVYKNTMKIFSMR